MDRPPCTPQTAFNFCRETEGVKKKKKVFIEQTISVYNCQHISHKLNKHLLYHFQEFFLFVCFSVSDKHSYTVSFW